ncbi:hypothetical protein ZWY2020_056585 [Hordeum vulgare]|nr:hypothetical protein ZWY2020_056585 [Hordeum vulgare]
MERYELLKDIGAGNFGVARLMRNKETKELVAMKYIPRGLKIDENVAREIINHRSLRHPNIIRFKEVVVTPTHLAIVMEYAAGGELFDRICNAGRFSEDEARYFFQQLICGVSYCHFMQICHRDLKLENTLLDGSPAPRLKICDFGYSKSSLLHSKPKSTVGTPAYIAPEVLSRREYDGKTADVWSCGVTLYVMLVGGYPFEDPDDPKNFRKTIGRIMSIQYKIPEYVHVSQDCKQLLASIFVANPAKRITMREIRNHPWFLKNLPRELTEAAQAMYYKRDNSAPTYSVQSVEEIMKIVEEAQKPPPSTTPVAGFGWAEEDEQEDGKKPEEEAEEDDEEDEYEKQLNEVRASGFEEEMLDELIALASRLQWLALRDGIKDGIVWKLSDNGIYSTKSGYKLMFSTHVGTLMLSLIWWVKATLKSKRDRERYGQNRDEINKRRRETYKQKKIAAAENSAGNAQLTISQDRSDIKNRIERERYAQNREEILKRQRQALMATGQSTVTQLANITCAGGAVPNSRELLDENENIYGGDESDWLQRNDAYQIQRKSGQVRVTQMKVVENPQLNLRIQEDSFKKRECDGDRKQIETTDVNHDEEARIFMNEFD